LHLYRLLPKRFRAKLLLGGHWQHDTRRHVHRLSGAALLVKRAVIEDVGGLDENYHMYGEDVEWCLRMVRAGWQLIFEPAASVLHHGNQSSMLRWDSLEVGRRILDGNLRFQKQCLSRPHFVANIVAASIVALAAHGWRRLRRIDTPNTSMALRLYTDYLKASFR
jgi:GT2 family glycosyltransferase